MHQLGKSSIDDYLKCWKLLPTTLQEKKKVMKKQWDQKYDQEKST